MENSTNSTRRCLIVKHLSYLRHLTSMVQSYLPIKKKWVFQFIPALDILEICQEPHLVRVYCLGNHSPLWWDRLATKVDVVLWRKGAGMVDLAVLKVLFSFWIKFSLSASPIGFLFSDSLLIRTNTCLISFVYFFW